VSRPAALLAVALLALAGCPGRGTPDTARRSAVVLFSSAVADAEVVIDDRPIGRIRDLKSGVAVSPGFHRFEIRRDGYHTRYLELTLEAGERRRLDIELAEMLP
jgi:hypothetical protein